MIMKEASSDRLAAFSDGVIAVIITIMVLELKAPHDASWASLLRIWPTFLSYALSYLLVGVVWVNHHHLLRYPERPDLWVIWANLAFLFFVSLIPFFTSYMAENHLNSFTTALYAGVFLLITISFMFLQRAITRRFREGIELKAGERAANWLALALYLLAIPAAYLHPAISLALIFGVAVLYFVPEAFHRVAR
jgi:uncharacterized membrane protein